MKRRAHLLPVTVLIAFPLVLYAPLLFGGKVLYWGVYLLQFYPWRQLAVEQIRAGYWPLWNPYLGAGAPLAANLQTAAFYPPNLLFLLMPVERAFGWELALHVALAGLFAYYLARTLGLRPFGALVSALAYGGGGYIVARWVFPSIVYAAAWLPLMLAFTEKLLRRATGHDPAPTARGVARAGIGGWGLRMGLLALAIALQLLAGHAQTSFYSLLIVTAYALFRLAQWQVAGDALRVRPLLKAACSLLLAALWGFALAAIQLLPSAELAMHSQRAGTLSNLRFAYELSFWPWRLITLLAPDFFGNPARNEYWAYGSYWEEAAFLGILPLVLGGVALAGWWRKRPSPAPAAEGPAADQQASEPGRSLVPFLALLALASIALALGDHTPLYPLLFRYVPGFGLFQAPARLMLGYALAMALLAGIGAEALRLTPRTKIALRLTVVVGLAVGLAGILVWLGLPAIRPSFGSSTARLGLTLALAAALLLLRGRRLRKGYWQGLVVALVGADLLAFGWGLAPGTDPAVYQAPVLTAGFLESQPEGRVFVAEPYAQQMYDEFVSLRSFGPAEPAYLQPLRESLLPNLNAVHSLRGVGNYDPLTVAPYRDLWDRLEGEQGAPPTLDEIRPVLNLFGVRYIITEDDLPLPRIYGDGPSQELPYPASYRLPEGQGLEGQATTEVTGESHAEPSIYRNDEALPMAFVVPGARVIEAKEMRLAALLDPTFDPYAEVVLSHAPTQAGLPVEAPTDAGNQPEPWTLRRGPNRVIILVSMTQPGYLVLTDTYYPGWRAIVDGEPAEILPANHAFRAVPLDAGDHSVIFEYAPLSFHLGAWTTLGASLALVTALLAGWRRRRVA